MSKLRELIEKEKAAPAAGSVYNDDIIDMLSDAREEISDLMDACVSNQVELPREVLKAAEALDKKLNGEG